MQQQQTQTQTSYIEEQTIQTEDQQHMQQKKPPKKNKKKSTNQKQQQIQDNFKTPKKRTKSSDQVLSQQQTTKSTKKKQPKPSSSPTPTRTPTPKSKPPNPTPQLSHTPIFQKLLTSTILTIISITLFHQPPIKQLPPAIYEQGTHKPVFQIVTDRMTSYLKIQVQNKRDLVLGFQSTKTANLKVGVEYTLGYQYEAKHDTDVMGVSSNVKVEMSDLKVLHYSINNVSMIQSSNGFFNSWQFDDYEKLKDIVRQNYMKQMEKKTLSSLTDYKKKIYQQKAKYMLNNIVEKYQSWFDWILKRVDGLLDNSLSPYIKQYKAHNQEQQKKKNEKNKKSQKENKTNDESQKNNDQEDFQDQFQQ